MEITNITDVVLPDTNGRQWYHEVIRNSRQLIIVAGDSWTWGDSLGTTTLEFDDYDYRTRHIYGNILSELLACDFINIGMPGRSNLDILEHVNLVLDNLKKDYDEIQVVMTLTEIGRELVEVNALLANSSHYNDVWKGADWPEFSQLLDYTASFEQLQLVQQETQNTLFGHSINLCLTLQKAINLKDLFSICERYTFLAIDKSLAERNVKYALARNFTNTVESNYNIVNKLIKSRWVDIIAERGGLTPYPNPVYCLTQMAIAPLVKFSEPLNTKQDWLSVLQLAEQAIDWLDASPYNSKRASKHPLEQAHQWWAEYLHYKLQG